MDCRKPLVLALGLLGAVAGCRLPDGNTQVTTVKKPAEEPIARKAPTFVTFGDLRAKAAQAPDCPPAAQQTYREEARMAYQRALEIDPNYAPAHVALGRLFDELGDRARSTAAYHKALELNDKDARLWYELSVCHCRHKDWAPGIEALKKACERDPDNRQYANALGFALARAGNFRESYACLARANGPAKAHYNLARVLRYMNQDDLARQHVLMALEQDPNLTVARALLAEMDGRAPLSESSAVQPVGHTETVPMPLMQANTAGPGPMGELAPPISVPPLPVINGEMRRGGRQE